MQNVATLFSHSGDMIAGVETENGSRDPDHDHAPFWGSLSSTSRTWYSLSVCKIWLWRL